MQQREQSFQQRNSAHMHTNTEIITHYNPEYSHSLPKIVRHYTTWKQIFISLSSIHLGEHKY